MSNPEALFFHQRDPNLHHSPDVEYVAGYLRQTEHIPNEPLAKIEAYLGALASPNLINDGIITGDQASIDRQIELAVVGPNDISESYFDLQLRIMREEMGFDEFRITPDVRSGLVEMVREDQRVCLEEWATYLTSDDAIYPNWFKLYAFSSVIKLTEYDAGKEHFRRRSNGTAANFPELNQEALAAVFETINSAHSIDPEREADENDELLSRLAQTANFGKMYSRAFNLAKPSREERFGTTEGRWTKYSQTDDPTVITQLTRSLVGHGTTWCTANTGTATAQLGRGDFYIYYSLDKNGECTIPRLAIRMERERVAEVRGIEPGQNVEECMMDITSDRLADLPGGDFYQRVAADMKKVKAIYESVEAGKALDVHDIFFLREYGGKIHRFGYRRDRRVDRLLLGRDEDEDFNLMINMFGHAKFSSMLIEAGQASLLFKRLALFDSAAIDKKSLANGLIEGGDFELLLKHFEQFDQGIIDTKKLADAMLEPRHSSYGTARLIGEYFQYFSPADFDLKVVASLLMDSGRYRDVMKRFDLLGEHVDKVTLAEKLANGSSHLAAQNIDKFGLNKEQCLEIALSIASHRSGAHHLTQHFKKFAAITGEKALADALLDAEHTEVVAKAAHKFDGGIVDQYDLVATMIEAGKLSHLADNLHRFDPEVVDHNNLYQLLLEARSFEVITRNLRKFEAGVIDSKSYYKDLIAQGRSVLLCSHLDQFDPEVIDMRVLIEDVAAQGNGKALFRNFDSMLKHYSQKEIADLLIATGNAMALNVNRYRFDEGAIDFDALAHALIEEDDAKNAKVVVKNFDIYQSQDITAAYLVELLRQAGQVAVISQQFKTFAANMEHTELAEALLGSGQPELLKVAITNLEKFDDDAIDTDKLVTQLVTQGEVKLLSRNISKVLARMDNAKLARMLCVNGGAEVVYRHQDKFADGAVVKSELVTGLIREGKTRLKLVRENYTAESQEAAERPKTIMELASSGAGRVALRQLVTLPTAESETVTPAVIDKLIERNEAHLIVTTMKKLPDDLDLQQRIVDSLLGSGNASLVMSHHKKFKSAVIDMKKIATGLFAQGDEEAIERSLDIFMRTMNPADFMTELVKQGYAHLIEDNFERFLEKLDHDVLATALIEIGLDDLLEDHRDKFKDLAFVENI